MGSYDDCCVSVINVIKYFYDVYCSIWIKVFSGFVCDEDFGVVNKSFS